MKVENCAKEEYGSGIKGLEMAQGLPQFFEGG
jgi:hypothetical protein